MADSTRRIDFGQNNVEPFDQSEIDNPTDKKPRRLRPSSRKYKKTDITPYKLLRNAGDVYDKDESATQVVPQVKGIVGPDLQGNLRIQKESSFKSGSQIGIYEETSGDFDSVEIQQTENTAEQERKVDRFRAIKRGFRPSGRIDIGKSLQELAEIRNIDTSSRTVRGELLQGNRNYQGHREKIQNFYRIGEELKEPYVERTFTYEKFGEDVIVPNTYNPGYGFRYPYNPNEIGKHNPFVLKDRDQNLDDITELSDEDKQLYYGVYKNTKTVSVKTPNYNEAFSNEEIDYDSYNLVNSEIDNFGLSYKRVSIDDQKYSLIDINGELSSSGLSSGVDLSSGDVIEAVDVFPGLAGGYVKAMVESMLNGKSMLSLSPSITINGTEFTKLLYLDKPLSILLFTDNKEAGPMYQIFSGEYQTDGGSWAVDHFSIFDSDPNTTLSPKIQYEQGAEKTIIQVNNLTWIQRHQTVDNNRKVFFWPNRIQFVIYSDKIELRYGDYKFYNAESYENVPDIVNNTNRTTYQVSDSADLVADADYIYQLDTPATSGLGGKKCNTNLVLSSFNDIKTALGILDPYRAEVLSYKELCDELSDPNSEGQQLFEDYFKVSTGQNYIDLFVAINTLIAEPPGTATLNYITTNSLDMTSTYNTAYIQDADPDLLFFTDLVDYATNASAEFDAIYNLIPKLAEMDVQDVWNEYGYPGLETSFDRFEITGQIGSAESNLVQMLYTRRDATSSLIALWNNAIGQDTGDNSVNSLIGDIMLILEDLESRYNDAIIYYTNKANFIFLYTQAYEYSNIFQNIQNIVCGSKLSNLRLFSGMSYSGDADAADALYDCFAILYKHYVFGSEYTDPTANAFAIDVSKETSAKFVSFLDRYGPEKITRYSAWRAGSTPGINLFGSGWPQNVVSTENTCFYIEISSV